jgi:alanyl-tRNA synthetase
MEAVAGTAALHKVREERGSLSAAAGLLKCPPHQVAERVLALQAQAKLAKTALTTEIPDGEELLAQLQSPTQPSWQHLQGISADGLRQLADQLKGKRVPPLLLLTGGEGEQLPFVILCPPTSPWNAGEMAKKFGLFVGGGGGGRADFAQGQGAQNGDLKQATEDFFGSLPTPA